MNKDYSKNKSIESLGSIIPSQSACCEDEASFLSRLLFSWLNPVLLTGSKRAVEFNDLPRLSYGGCPSAHEQQMG